MPKTFKQLSVKTRAECAWCKLTKRGKFFYSYLGEDKVLFCDKCEQAISDERREVEQNSAAVFDKESVAQIYREKLKELEDKLIDYNKLSVRSDVDLVVLGIINSWRLEILRERKIIKYRLASLLSDKSDPQRKTFDLELIKNLPLSIILGEPTSKTGGKHLYKCPLHKEKTASFTYFEKDKRFYCFGCGGKGSIIDLFMKLNNCDFKVACNELQQYL